MRRASPAALLALAVLAACGRGASATHGPKPVKARVLTVEHKEVRRDVLSVGSLFPYEEVAVSSEVEGKVERVLVDVGDRVGKGQGLVKVPLDLGEARRGGRGRGGQRRERREKETREGQRTQAHGLRTIA